MSYEDQLIRESTGEGLPSWHEVHEDYEPNTDEDETKLIHTGQFQKGALHRNWKGERGKYRTLHKRVESVRGRPQKCEVCARSDADTKYHWANLTGNYVDPNDYKRMCRTCHIKHDAARITHCMNGHEFTPENTRITPAGHRRCRECHRIEMRKSPKISRSDLQTTGEKIPFFKRRRPKRGL